MQQTKTSWFQKVQYLFNEWYLNYLALYNKSDFISILFLILFFARYLYLLYLVIFTLRLIPVFVKLAFRKKTFLPCYQ